MTKVTIRADCIEICGHAPQPVVCHGISAISQMTANYLEKYGTATIKRSDGYLKICDIIHDDYSVFILEAFQDALKDIANEYPGNIIFKNE